MPNISSSIAYTYVSTNKKLTIVAALGILIGMSVYIFLNSMLVGFDKRTSELVFRGISHIKVYKDDETSKPLVNHKNKVSLIVNPKIISNSNTIINPKILINTLAKQKDVLVVAPQINVGLFYSNGKSQFAGSGIGIYPNEANEMYDIKSTMVDGDFDRLKLTLNGILIGSGIAKKMNAAVGDNLSVTSSKGVTKIFNIIGIFKTNNSFVDKKNSYINLFSAQQLLKESNSYTSEINIKIIDPKIAETVAKRISILTPYKVESWQESNASLVAADKIRGLILGFVSITVLVVAAFGIYNIINMTVSQKINDIAILKAIGFKGKDVIRIFVTQAITVGMMGVFGGVITALLMITALKNVYISVDIGYFPVYYEPLKFTQGIFVGLAVTFLAGYIPAKKAANIDPVKIFRR